MPIRFPDDLRRRHHLYVARTRMGKSTLMHHLVTHKMREKAEGRDSDAIVVIGPPHRPGVRHPRTRPVVRVAKGLWEQWGPRMQSILEQTVKTLHEANEHPTTDEGVSRQSRQWLGQRVPEGAVVGVESPQGRQRSQVNELTTGLIGIAGAGIEPGREIADPV